MFSECVVWKMLSLQSLDRRHERRLFWQRFAFQRGGRESVLCVLDSSQKPIFQRLIRNAYVHAWRGSFGHIMHQNRTGGRAGYGYTPTVTSLAFLAEIIIQPGPTVQCLLIGARIVSSYYVLSYRPYYGSPTVWNSLPATLRGMPTLPGFKAELKTYFIRQAFP